MIAFNKFGGFVVKHLPAIFTACGITLAGASIPLTIDAVNRAKARLEAAEDQIAMDEGYVERLIMDDGKNADDDLDSHYILGVTIEARHLVAQDLKPAQKLKIIWPHMIPPTLTFVGSALFIIFAHNVHVKRYGVLMAAYTASEGAYRHYYEKSQQLIGGPKKREELEASVAQSYLDDPKAEETPIISVTGAGSGEFLFLEPLSYQFFYANQDYLEILQAKLTNLFESREYVTFGDFLSIAGLASSALDELFWEKIEPGDQIILSKKLGTTSRPMQGVPVGTPCYVLTTNLPAQRWRPMYEF